jgi:putative transposase
MARSGRLDWSGAVQHVMARGIEKRAIFMDEDDRVQFVNRIRKCVAETGISIYAWALMPNHVHFLIQTGNVPISKFMQKLLTGYAVYFNKKYDRVGHLFQNRFKSVVVQAETYLLKLIGYIHLNPLKSEIVKDYDSLKHYLWTGHIGLMFPGFYPWQETDQVLNTFSGNKTTKIGEYEEFISRFDNSACYDGRFEEGSFLLGNKGLLCLEEATPGEISGNSHHRILGDIDFAHAVLSRLRQFRRNNLRDRGSEHDSVDRVIKYAEEKWKISRTALSSSGRTRSVSRARECVCYVLVNIVGLSLTDAGRILNLSGQAVHSAGSRFQPMHGFHDEIQRVLSQEP